MERTRKERKKEIGTDTSTLGFKWIDMDIMDMIQGLYTTGKRKSEFFVWNVTRYPT